MRFATIGLCAILSVTAASTTVMAQQLQTLSSETTQLYARVLVDQFEKEFKDRPSKIEADVDRAKGLHVDQDGIILVPAKGLKEDSIDPAVESENGAGLCYLFLSPCYAPLADGKSIDSKNLYRIKYNDGQGGQKEAICLLVTVKHKGGDDWRLFGFGPQKAPVVDSQFGESSSDVEKPLAMTVSGGKNNKADLALTLFKKYSASFAIGSK
jgi:hypothetical protein